MAGGDSPQQKLVSRAVLDGSDAQGSLEKLLIWDERDQIPVKVKVNMKGGVWVASSNSDGHRV